MKQVDPTGRLNDDDQRLLMLWRDNLSLQDPRYHGKGLAHLAYESMVDDDFRHRLVSDSQSVLADLAGKLEELPDGVTLRFFENTSDTLNVVLPPRAGVVTSRPGALKDLLTSRTSAEFSASGDDWDFGNLTDSGPAPGHADGGDPDSIDGPIFVTE
jgi:hypothetical protein